MKYPAKLIITTLLTASIFWFTADKLASTVAGNKPQGDFKPRTNETSHSTIVTRLKASQDPKDREMLADFYFGRKEFELAAAEYRYVLERNQNNESVRGRLASALTFMRQFDEALKELNILIKDEPDSFQGHAYIAITYAQMGNVGLAKEYGKLALDLAPNQEAKERLSSFLNTLEPAPDAKNALENYLQNNEVTKNKFKAGELKEGIYILDFVDFPMDAMPPFAREKFINSLKENSQDLDISYILIRDFDSKKELAQVPIDRENLGKREAK